MRRGISGLWICAGAYCSSAELSRTTPTCQTNFVETGFQTHAPLRRKDSDNDGLTNGQELGDPCCTFASSGNAAAALLPPGFTLASYEVSHPGFASSVTSTPVAVASFCPPPEAAAAAPAPGGASAALAPAPAPGAAFSSTDKFFNPGEIQRSFNLSASITIASVVSRPQHAHRPPAPVEKMNVSFGCSEMQQGSCSGQL